MIKLFKNLSKKDILLIIISLILVIISVNLDLKLPEYMSNITRLIETEGSSINDILKEGSFMILCAFLSLIITIIVGYIAALISSSFSMNLRKKVYDKVMSFSLSEIKEFQTGSLITRTTNDVTQMEMLIAIGMQMLMKALIMALLAVSKILNKSVELSILTGVCVMILLFVITIITIIVLPRFSIVQKLIDKINNLTRENLTGLKVIRAFNANKYQEDKFSKTNKELTNTLLFNQRMFAILMPIMLFVMNMLSLGIYFIGSSLIDKATFISRIDLFSNVVVFMSYGMQVIMSFLMLAFVFMIVPRTQVSAKRINEVLDKELSIKDGTFNSSTMSKGTIEFKNVSFKYPDAKEYLIKDISFKINKGEKVAFIGSTASGKSTLVNLIPRFYDVSKGSILIDDIDVKDYKLTNLYSKIGYISQKAFIFNGSIKYNINYGTDHFNKDKLIEAIEISKSSDFVYDYPDSYKHHIARNGINLSGGQKQRLSIARAIYKDPEIYIFDDTFSALDFKTDRELRNNLDKYTKDKTILIVAQRIGTILDCDKIVVLENGNCVGIGTHKELLKNCPVYKEIALSQLSMEELDAQ